jgi:hypothetical protein
MLLERAAHPFELEIRNISAAARRLASPATKLEQKL